jgi:putative endonuclease
MAGRIPMVSLIQTLVVAEHLNFRHAANVLGVTQSSISSRVKALEETLGVQLFERRHRGVRPDHTGATEDLKRRISDHNTGKSSHTAKFKPWKLVWYCAFPDKYKALAFEKYLKSHSSRAFAKKRL